jgi:hypothetical protein
LDDPTIGVNAIPLGSHDGTGVPETTTTQTIVGESAELTMKSLWNKNKRRGFKNAMGKEVPSKIFFSEEADPNSGLNGRIRAPAPRVIPPSEKGEKGLLPPNIFVTSVHVEEGLGSGKKRKYVTGNTERLETPPAASYSAGKIDRTAIESRWESLGLVSGASELPTGTIVGWKVSATQSFA